MLNISRPPPSPVQCWDITEQLRVQALKFCSTLGQGQGRKEKKELKTSNLPNTFDDDCSVDFVNYDFGQNPINSNVQAEANLKSATNILYQTPDQRRS